MADLGNQITRGENGIVCLDQGDGVFDVSKIGLALKIWTGEKPWFG